MRSALPTTRSLTFSGCSVHVAGDEVIGAESIAF